MKSLLRRALNAIGLIPGGRRAAVHYNRRAVLMQREQEELQRRLDRLDALAVRAAVESRGTNEQRNAAR